MSVSSDYSVLAVLLFITALATVANASKMLWDGVGHWTIAAETLPVLDQLLVALMLVKILHTVRISIRSPFLVKEPFLVVGLIASIRRTPLQSDSRPSTLSLLTGIQ